MSSSSSSSCDEIEGLKAKGLVANLEKRGVKYNNSLERCVFFVDNNAPTDAGLTDETIDEIARLISESTDEVEYVHLETGAFENCSAEKKESLVKITVFEKKKVETKVKPWVDI